MKIRFIITVVLVLFGFLPAEGGRPERYYQDEWCRNAGGTTEYVLTDGTRVDCLTGEYAIEFDFAKKWAEAIGQSLYYAVKTGRKPAVVLIMKEAKDARYLKRLEIVADKAGITVWTTGGNKRD